MMTELMTKSVTSVKSKRAEVPSKLNMIYIKDRLNKIFSSEMEAEDSIFVRVNGNVINKLASFIIGDIPRACSVGIAGETASGKSTIAFYIINNIKDFAADRNLDNVITRINIDDYYYDRS